MPDIAFFETHRPELAEILKTSAGLMAQRGYHGTSMRDLAKVTGRSLSGLYHYFQGKEDLLYLVNRHGFSSLHAMMDTLESEKRNPAEALHQLITNHIVYFADHLDEMRVIMFGTQDLAPDRGGTVNALKESYRVRVQKIVGTYVQVTFGESLEPADLTRKTYLLFGMMNWIFGWYSSGDHGSPDDLADDIFNTFTRGCTAK
jgi:AcrR family transcriptional regulator